MLLAHVWLGVASKCFALLCACRHALVHSGSLEGRTKLRSRSGGGTICLVGNAVGLAESPRVVLARLNHKAKVHAALVQASTLRRARPNPSLKLTRYGSRRLAAPGAGGIIPSAAKRRLPTRAA